MTTTLVRARSAYIQRALGHAASPTTWRSALAVGRADATVAPALRVGIAALVVLIAGGFLGRVDLAGFAVLGAVCSAFGRYEAYPRRAGKLALVCALTIMFVLLGAVLGAMGAPASVQLVAISLCCGVAAWLIGAFDITGPGPVILVFCATAAVGFTRDWSDIAPVVAATVAGAVVGWVAAMFPALAHPVGPAQLSTARALASVGRHIDSPDGPSASAAITRARTVLALSGSRARDLDHYRALSALLDDAQAISDAVDRGEHAVDAASVLGHERGLRKIRRYTTLDAPRSISPRTVPEGWFSAGVRALSSRSLIVNGFRITGAALLAAWAASAIGFEHPLWAAMGAVAAMQGVTFETTVHRGIQRLVGNIGGAAIGAGLIALSLGYWQTVAAIVATQVAAELLVLKNYALTSMAVTPMALLLTGLATHLEPAVALSRVGDTLIGVLIGIVVAAMTIEVTNEFTGSRRIA